MISPAATVFPRAFLTFSKDAYRIHMESWSYKDPIVQSEILANAKDLMTKSLESLTTQSSTKTAPSIHLAVEDELALWRRLKGI